MADVSSVPFVNYAGQQADAQLTQAQTGATQQQGQLAGQQTQAAAMQNQIMKARMPLIMSALSDYADDTSSSNASGASGQPVSAKAPPSSTSGVAPDTSAGSPETSWYDPKNIDSALRQKYFVPPVTPQEAQRIQRAALIGDPGLLENSKMQRQFRIDQQTAASQYDANNLYDSIHTVVDAEPGHALAQLAAIAPGTAKKIKDMIPDEADEDAAARAYAAHVGGNVHQYTGRKVVARADGSYVDEVTGRPVPGVEKSGLSEEQWANLAKAGNALVDMDDGQGHKVKVPQWRANQAPSLDSWVMQQASHGGEYGAHATVGGAPKAQAKAAAQKAVATATADTKATSGVAGAPKEGTTTTNGQPDPLMSKALGDTDYKYAPPTHKFGTSMSPDEQDQKTKQTDAAVSLKTDLDKGIPNAQSALTFYKAAQDIMDTKGASGGKYQALLARAAAWVPGLQAPNTSNYQELAKYLGNAALQAGKGIFPKMTQKEAFLILNELNPSPGMNDAALRNMIGFGTRMSQYSIDGAQRAGAYLKSGGDATRFYSWLNKYWPQPDAVVPKGEGKNEAPKYSDAQIAKYARVHGLTLEVAKNHVGAK